MASPQKFVENSILLCLGVDKYFHGEECLAQFRSVINWIEKFNNFDQCFQRLEQMRDENVFLLCSDQWSDQLVLLEEKFRQIDSIYLFCEQASGHGNGTASYKSVKGTFTNLRELLNQLRKDVQHAEKNFISSGTISQSSVSNPNELDPSFMYCQLIKEKFLKISSNKNSNKELVDYCRPTYEGNIDEQKLLNDFEKSYAKENKEQSPIWWYTRESFLYRTLNKALRTLDIETLMKMNFYVRDLHEQIQQRFDQPQNDIPSVVYRGQVLFHDDWQKLEKNIHGLYYFNSFLSTSEKKSKGLDFARKDKNEEKVGILFKININRSNSWVPFASIEDITAVKYEKEILFSIGSVFRIDQIDEIESNLWQVQMTMSNDRDPLLTRLTDHLRRSLGQGSEWRQLGQLMIKMGHFRKGKEIFEQLFSPSNELSELIFLHNQLGHCEKQLNNLHKALEHYQKAIESSEQLSMSPLDLRLSSIYSNIGAIWKKLKNFDEALKYFEFVLQIDENATNSNRLEIAVDYNNIGSVLDEQGKYSQALKNYKKALEIKLIILPPTDPSLANNYINIGIVYRKTGDSSTGLRYYEKALEIQRKSLTSDHPSLINTFSNMSTACEHLGRRSEAIQHAQEAAKIAQKALGSNHPETKRREETLQRLAENRSIDNE